MGKGESALIQSKTDVGGENPLQPRLVFLGFSGVSEITNSDVTFTHPYKKPHQALPGRPCPCVGPEYTIHNV